MAEDDPRPRLRCFLAFSDATRESVAETVLKTVRQARFRPVPSDPIREGRSAIREAALTELTRADCVIADLTDRDPKVIFEIGVAHAMGKGLFLLAPYPGLAPDVLPVDLRAFQILSYRPDASGLGELSKALGRSLREHARFPRRAGRQIPGARLAVPFFVDFNQLSQEDVENLCRELLAQMGYQSLEWSKESREFDLIAELPKRDPDGFEYRELWLVSMGRNAPPDMLLERALHDPEYFVHRFFGGERFDRLMSRGGGEVPITLLIISLREELRGSELDMLRRPKRFRGPSPFTVRVRVWDRMYLTTLIQQFPQLGYKYFSDEGRSKSKFRKTPEQLYSENAALTNRLAASNRQLVDEKDRRVRAERDAVWKDISFSAAHKMGNPIFAIETFLDPLEKRVMESRLGEAKDVIQSIRNSVEKAKGIVDQFKSLTRAQEIKPVPTVVRPVLEDACKMAVMQGIVCEIDCPPDLTVLADPERFGECCDEIISNATHWLDKSPKTIRVTAAIAPSEALPQAVDSSRRYAVIHFTDNGSGVAVECKERIFDAFFTTRDHGTGLGLAVCRRIIEGLGGIIRELGRPGEGADFEIYLPLPMPEPVAAVDEKLTEVQAGGA